MQVFTKKLFKGSKVALGTKMFAFQSAKKPLFLYPGLVRRYGGGEAHVLTEEEIAARIIDVLKNFEKVDPNSVTNKSHFINDLGLDSLDAVEVGLAIEDEFGIEIPEQDAEKIISVPDAINYILTNPHAK